MLKSPHILVVVALFTLALTACGKPKSEETRQRTRAETLIEQQKNLVRTLDNAGVPSPSWSDEDLNAYEANLNQLLQVEVELNALNDSRGVVIIGAHNESEIEKRRQLVQTARKIKNIQSTTEDDQG